MLQKPGLEEQCVLQELSSKETTHFAGNHRMGYPGSRKTISFLFSWMSIWNSVSKGQEWPEIIKVPDPFNRSNTEEHTWI